MLSLLSSKPDKPKALGCSSQDIASRPCTSFAACLWMHGLTIFPQKISMVTCPSYLMRREKNAKAEIILLPGWHCVTAQGFGTTAPVVVLLPTHCQFQLGKDGTELHFPHFMVHSFAAAPHQGASSLSFCLLPQQAECMNTQFTPSYFTPDTQDRSACAKLFE